MSAVQKIEPQAMQIAPVSETAAILNLIERVARDPSVDMDKLVRLLELRDKTESRIKEEAFDLAMTEAQGEMRPVARDSNNPQTRSRYASYFALDNALRPVYTKHGFSLSFNQGDAPLPEYVRVECRVSRGGHSRNYHLDMPADGKGAKGGDVMTKTHATGSAVQYGMRYLLKMIFNIATGERDDDGNAAGSGEKINEMQIGILRSLIVEVAADIPKFCKYMKVERIEDISASRYDAAVKALEAKRSAS